MYKLPWSRLGALVLSALFAGTTFAQGAFPTRHVTLTGPVGVGGGTDLVARTLLAPRVLNVGTVMGLMGGAAFLVIIIAVMHRRRA